MTFSLEAGFFTVRFSARFLTALLQALAQLMLNTYICSMFRNSLAGFLVVAGVDAVHHRVELLTSTEGGTECE